MVLRDDSGRVVDSLNYGGLVDPWAAEGFQAKSGMEQSGCYVPAPGPAGGFGPVIATNSSAGRFPDGVDSGSNCTDFKTQAATTLPIAAVVGATNIKVASVEGFDAGQKIMIDQGASMETAVIATVGTAGGTTVRTATAAGATTIPVAGTMGFKEGQNISIDNGADSEMAVIASIARFPSPAITIAAPLTHAHPANAMVAGTGITLAAPLTRAHGNGAQVSDNIPTPGAPNQYQTTR